MNKSDESLPSSRFAWLSSRNLDKFYGVAWFRVLISKALRFGLVGILTTAIYVVVAMVCVSKFAINTTLAGIVGCCCALPFSFAAHRQYTFVAGGIVWSEALRFSAVHAVNVAVAAGTIAIMVDVLGFGFSAGLVASLIVAPAVTFLMMNFWVFRNQRDARSSGWKD